MSDLNLVLAGNRMRLNFLSAGFTMPKNFVDINKGQSLLEACIIQASCLPGRNVCALPKEDLSHPSFFKLRQNLDSLEVKVDFIPLPETTSSVQSALWAADWMDGHAVNVLPGDVLIESFSEKSKSWTAKNYLVSTRGYDERWGFIEFDDYRLRAFKSKSAISDSIATGFFRFANGLDFIDAAFDCLTAWRGEGPIQIGHIAELISYDQVFSVYEVPENDFKPLASAGDVRRFMFASLA